MARGQQRRRVTHLLAGARRKRTDRSYGRLGSLTGLVRVGLGRRGAAERWRIVALGYTTSLWAFGAVDLLVVTAGANLGLRMPCPP